MKEPEHALVQVTCEGGHIHFVPFSNIRGLNACPACGKVDHIDPEQIPQIEAAFGRAMMEAAAQRDAGAIIGIGSANVPRRRS